MPEITFLRPDGSAQTITVDDNISIMQAATENKIPGIEGACGGSMACATCHVYVHPGWKTRVEGQDNEQSDEEVDILDTAWDIRDESRLGCQVKLTKALDGLVVALPGTKTGW